MRQAEVMGEEGFGYVRPDTVSYPERGGGPVGKMWKDSRAMVTTHLRSEVMNLK